MINDYDKGGLKMVDIKSFREALKLKWIGKYLDNDNQSKWKLFFTYYLQERGGTLIKAADAHASSAFVKWKFFVFRFCRLLSSSSLVLVLLVSRGQQT